MRETKKGKNQKTAKNKILRQLATINEMIKEGALDKYEAARIKDKIDPAGTCLELTTQ